MRIPYKIGVLLMYVFLAVLGVLLIVSPACNMFTSSIATTGAKEIATANGYDYLRGWSGDVAGLDIASRFVGYSIYVVILLMPIMGGLMLSGGIAGIVVSAVALGSKNQSQVRWVGMMNLARILLAASFTFAGILVGVYFSVGISAFAAEYISQSGKADASTLAFLPLILVAVLGIAVVTIQALTQNEAVYSGLPIIPSAQSDAQVKSVNPSIPISGAAQGVTPAAKPFGAPAVDFRAERERTYLLCEYKKLLDEGVLSKEEFDAKKSKLLTLK